MEHQLVERISTLSHVRLEGMGLEEISGLEVLGESAVHLYLQGNSIRVIENLSPIAHHLQYLSLARNRIQDLCGLDSLHALRALDVANNELQIISPEALPRGLHYLITSGNPLQEMGEETWRRVMAGLPFLKSFNCDETITPPQTTFTPTKKSQHDDPWRHRALSVTATSTPQHMLLSGRYHGVPSLIPAGSDLGLVFEDESARDEVASTFASQTATLNSLRNFSPKVDQDLRRPLESMRGVLEQRPFTILRISEEDVGSHVPDAKLAKHAQERMRQMGKIVGR